MENNVCILGNGKSRMRGKWQRNPAIQHYTQLWVCNWAFKERFFKPIDRVGTVHPEVIKEAYDYREANELTYEIWTKPEIDSHKADRRFEIKKGWSTGNMLLGQALFEGYTEILLAGFDFGGPDIYQPTPRPGENFWSQYKEIKRTWPNANIVLL